MISANPWWEALEVVALAGFGTGLGAWFSGRKGRAWLAGYLLPLAVVLGCAATLRDRTLEALPPFVWMLSGWRRYALTALVAPVLFTTLLVRLPQRRNRAALTVLIGGRRRENVPAGGK
jgi:hypothetical protein